jgi:hypothetical protein
VGPRDGVDDLEKIKCLTLQSLELRRVYADEMSKRKFGNFFEFKMELSEALDSDLAVYCLTLVCGVKES